MFVDCFSRQHHLVHTTHLLIDPIVSGTRLLTASVGSAVRQPTSGLYQNDGRHAVSSPTGCVHSSRHRPDSGTKCHQRPRHCPSSSPHHPISQSSDQRRHHYNSSSRYHMDKLLTSTWKQKKNLSMYGRLSGICSLPCQP